MVTSILSNAASGLRTTQALLATVSRNITNAGTEGYSRKIQEAITSPAGAVHSGTVKRAADDLLAQQARNYAAARAGADTTAAALEEINRLTGSPDGTDSLSGRMSALADTLQQLATDPITPIGYQEVLEAANGLASTFRSSYAELSRVGADARAAIPDDVATANGLLEKVAGLNRQIVANSGPGNDATDLLDKRDMLVGQLSEVMNVRSFVDQRNVLHVFSADNKLLADEGAYPLTADGTGTVMAGNQPLYNVGGRIGANQNVAGQLVPTLTGQLDALAGRLTQALETAGVPVFNDGGSTPFDPAADPAQAVGFSGRIAVSAAVTTDTSLLRGGTAVPIGDTSLIVAARRAIVADPQSFGTPGLPANGTLSLAAATFVANVSSRTASAREDAQSRGVAEDLVRTRLSQITDVSIDEEMTRMVQLQTAYAANARVLQTAQSMIDELLNLVR